MSNFPNIPVRKPIELDFYKLPPNHNPMIQVDADSTFDNVQSSLCLLMRLVMDSEQMELHYSERETRGLLCVLECMEKAMRFELYHRADEDEGGECNQS